MILNTQSTVQVTLGLNSGAFTSGLSKLQESASKTLQNIGGVLNNVFSSDPFKTALGIKGFDLLEKAGTSAFSAISNQISQAVEFQNQLVGTASEYQKLLKTNYSTSFDIAKQYSAIFEQKSAGVPFKEVGDQINRLGGDYLLKAFYNQNDVLGSINKAADTQIKLQALIGGSIGKSKQKEAFIDSLFGTTGAAALNYSDIVTSQIYQHNVNLAKAFQDTLKQEGITYSQFNLQDRAQRAKFIDQFLKNANADEIVSSYGSTISGFFDKLGVSIFGKNGLLSFTRDLIPNLPNSDLLTSITNLFSETTGIFQFLAPVAQGIIDPLYLGIKLTIDALSFALKPINAIFKTLTGGTPLIYAATAALSTFFYVGVARFIAGNIGSVVSGAGGSLLGKLILSLIGGGGSSLLGLIPRAGTLAAQGIGLTAYGLGQSGLGAASVISSLSSLNFGAIVTGFRAMSVAATGFGASLLPLLANPITLAVAAIIGAGFTIWKYWKPISEFFLGIWDELAPKLKPVIDLFKQIGDILSSVLNPLISTFKSLWDSASNGISGFGQNVFKQEEAGNARGAGQSFAHNVISTLGNFFTFGAYDNHADGNVFGLIGAILKESQSMPSGARPVIANDSEIILNRNQQRSLANAYSSNGSLVFSPNVSVNITNSDMSPNTIKQAVMSALSEQWESMQASYHF